jgi:hypothetical protein
LRNTSTSCVRCVSPFAFHAGMFDMWIIFLIC